MKKELFDKNPILKLSFDFSLMVIEYCEQLEVNKKYVLSRQLLRSGTSIGANAMEAQNAESKADFLHKMRVAAKEAEETQYWLWLCNYSPAYPNCDDLITKLDEVNKVLGSIINSARKNLVNK
ncbi:four helix bundle protein [Flavipsychrobacter stenotrophus]|uniref:Four helix bundle protein n=1 Tax=Flavipsychrobacter stenotrophus TaxID=2077091 RepID=A0A2S7SQ18_9BACT|nr:four helix bundle protein [Flavipsychrobacter stenotrophus]PQJ08999.1 four helix bundle protein [Flavipsychrobacter stenotrophus]